MTQLPWPPASQNASEWIAFQASIAKHCLKGPVDNVSGGLEREFFLLISASSMRVVTLAYQSAKLSSR